MTAVITDYLRSTYSNEVEELRFVFEKANKFLAKWFINSNIIPKII